MRPRISPFQYLMPIKPGFYQFLAFIILRDEPVFSVFINDESFIETSFYTIKNPSIYVLAMPSRIVRRVRSSQRRGFQALLQA